ncbi:secreted RxLR effector protein 161-like [Cryptomeria japonica]|uniref:secreted RxLR effector protein 161-like n=1 Tax=Cryptomeria japonica TaxID=3369 RepID=UPI0027DAA0D6|nr:secreted RxLR effector protein 161-like [Cryptomeria japonica]
MTDCNPTATPFLSRVKLEDGKDTPLVDCIHYHQLMGNLLYLTHSHPDLSYVVGLASEYMQEPHELHWKVVKRILRYVQGTISYGIHYSVGCTLDLIVYTDSDWACDNIDHNSTSGYILSLGFGPICWSSKKQSTIALSSAKAEYRGAVNVTIQAIWLQNFLTELGIHLHRSTVIWCDNKSTQKFCRDPIQ